MPKRKPMTFFQSLEQGLSEALAFAEGRPKAGTRTFLYKAAKPRSPAQIKKLRKALGQTQAEFASLLSVSIKTVEAWEGDTKHPTGPALRLMELLERFPLLASQDLAEKRRTG